MKKTPTSVLMRRVAAVLYGIVALFELYLSRGYYNNYTVVFGPYLASMLLALGCAGIAVWLFSGEGPAGRKAGLAVSFATTLLVAKTLLLYNKESEALTEALELGEFSFADNDTWLYVIVIAKLMLLVIAAFFVLNSSAEADASSEIEELKAE